MHSISDLGMNATSSSNVDGDKGSRFNGAVCPVCKESFKDGEIVCPKDMELLVPAVIDPLIGSVIDRKYRLISLSGKGATAKVYKATHESIGRDVAVKVVAKSGDAASAKALERLHREARALSLVNHPNLPRLWDAGDLADGSSYLVLDYYEGSSLLEYMQTQGSVPYQSLVPIINQVCDALDHIHAHGMIHRDIKPDNIVVLTKPQGKINVKLIDFGICKFDDPGSSEETSKASLEFVGSPLYMSPENVNSALVDRRSDIYSLGATMYHALSGKPPMKETTLIDIVHAHKSVMPAPISYVSPEVELPLSLEAVVFRSLQKLPGNRYQTASDLKTALHRALHPDEYTGKLSQLEFSGAELRAMLAFVKGTSIEQVSKIMSQDEKTAESIRLALLAKLKSAIAQIETMYSPSGESLEELALENTQIGRID